jgi:hypothetical protein
VVSFTRDVCGQPPAGFADVTAGEIRAFLDGAADIPVAPRQTGPPGLNAVQPPVQGSPLSCEPGGWSGSPGFTYTFQTDTAPAQVLQSGPSAVYVPGGADLGKAIVCVVAAANGGGTASARSRVSPAIQADIVPPRSAIRSLSCRRRTCRMILQAADPNSQGAVAVRVTATYRVTVSCRRKGRRASCARTRARQLAIKQLDATTFSATGSGLPYRRVRLVAQVTDAAGNRAAARAARAAMRRR